MSNNTTYNGWTNRETWLVNLWLGDSLAEYVRDTLGQEIDASQAESYALDLVETSGATIEDAFTSDLISFALSGVNWQEIANAANE